MMMAFDDRDVSEFVDLVASTSPDMATITRYNGSVPDGHGGQIDSWEEVATVACRVTSLDPRPDEQVIAQQYVGSTLMAITVPHDTDVTRNDVITVTYDGGADAYEVVGVPPRRSYQARRRVIVLAVS